MKIEPFSELQQKYIVKTTEGANAFVPPTLPPKFDIGKIALNLAAAAQALGELNGAARRLQNPYILIGPLIRKEALTTSAMEGTITTIDDMLLEEVLQNLNTDENAREASNYKVALSKTLDQLATLPISHRVIKEGHKQLLSGLSVERGANKRPGEYKSHQNAIGQMGDTVVTARYVPPPPKETLECMDALEAFINREDRKRGEALIDIALCHYQFEAIHPFADGNGRIGRMLVTLMAMQFQILDLPLLHISANLENKKPEYIEKLFAVSARGEWEAWINFFLEAVQQSCERATESVDQIINLQSELKQRATQRHKNHRLSVIIDSLFEKEWTTAVEVQKLCAISFPTAQSDILELVKLEILQPMKKARPLIYVARPIWNLSARDR
jgi:Fic family protein